MALLLDEDEVCAVRATDSPKSAPPDGRILDSGAEMHESTSACKAASPSRIATTTPVAAAATQHRGRSPPCAGAAVTLPLKGGNGMEKMEALLFGKMKVTLVDEGSVAGRKRSSTEVLGTSVSKTPATQKTSSAHVCDGRVSGSSTQPKIVSAARSLSSLSPEQEHLSTSTLETVLMTPHEKSSQDVVLTSPEHRCGSLFASPPARPSQPSSALAREEGAVEASPLSVSAPPTKVQLRLSDFFSKMACKR
ncbi:hypothetical protein, conserved [Leishmania tarentolae]|uniref:Uncharacterized protein n=1 Tax=Leishmania tarentolae TaxID=5689 RepID=A0A640KQD2_LEITA|nr:hypothetical protein, conserved [Leishmania tarentolae]